MPRTESNWRYVAGVNRRRQQGCIKLLDFSLSSVGWRRGLGRGGGFLLVAPLLGPLPTRSSRGEDGELDAALRRQPAERLAVFWPRFICFLERLSILCGATLPSAL